MNKLPKELKIARGVKIHVSSLEDVEKWFVHVELNGALIAGKCILKLAAQRRKKLSNLPVHQ